MLPEDKGQTGSCKQRQDLEELVVRLSGVPTVATHCPRQESVEHPDRHQYGRAHATAVAADLLLLLSMAVQARGEVSHHRPSLVVKYHQLANGGQIPDTPTASAVGSSNRCLNGAVPDSKH